MIPGDIGRELGLRGCGTWRPAPAGTAAAPGTYATSLPFRLAAETGREPGEVAAGLAARLLQVSWIEVASVTGGGYLTVTVTAAALAALAIRVPAAGDACVSSGALTGTCLEAPSGADPGSAGNWTEAWRLVTATVTGRLAAAAGATVRPLRNTERCSSPDVAAAGNAGQCSEPPSEPDVAAAQSAKLPSPSLSTPASAVAAAGAEAVRYALARSPVPPAGPVDPGPCVRNTWDNPFFVVRYAHARAAAVLRWACDLGISRGESQEFRPELLAQPREQELLGAISWLPERVAAAARRRRPSAFIRDLESLAEAWLACSENCPALPFGGRSAPREEPGMAARLWLVAAAQTALAAGLSLADVAPPQRL